MGNSQPTNRTGAKATQQKLENAKKLGILSLQEHSLTTIPSQVYQLSNCKTLDLSHNQLSSLGQLHLLAKLKHLNLSNNNLPSGSLSPIASLKQLQNLQLSHNVLACTSSKSPPSSTPPTLQAVTKALATTNLTGGTTSNHHTVETRQTPPSKPLDNPILIQFPPSLKQLTLSHNFFTSIPSQLVEHVLPKLELLDLSHNNIKTVPDALAKAVPQLHELNLDHNRLSSLPASLGTLQRLKVLHLRHNQLSANENATKDQSIPAVIFTETSLIDLNLHGNPLTNTQLNQFTGFDQFLQRRQGVKNKTLTNLDVCGLE